MQSVVLVLQFKCLMINIYNKMVLTHIGPNQNTTVGLTGVVRKFHRDLNAFMTARINYCHSTYQHIVY